MVTGGKLYFEDVKGDEGLQSFEIEIARAHIIRYAGASGDFAPIHLDEELAKSLGFPSIFAQGMMHGGMLSRLVTDWAGDGRVTRYKIRFEALVWPKDVLTFKGQVLRKYQEGGENLVDCQLFVVNNRGENAIVGEATVSLPLKAS